MKMLIEVDTKSKESLQEVIDFCEGYLNFTFKEKNIPQINSKVPTTNDISSDDETPSEDKKSIVEPPRAENENVEKRKRRTKAEMEELKVETTEKPSISLSELKDLAQQKAQTVDRKKVKDAISKYAEKLNEVAEKDFEALYKDLKAI